MNPNIEVNQHDLVNAWQAKLPLLLDPLDKAEVRADEANQNSLRIHIDTAGRQMYSFDFECAYMDPREVRVDLVDVERDGRAVDEYTEVIQDLAGGYTRQLHECAQMLHGLTNPN
ncbi:hypothetical protein J2T13_004641 [Paenibacillus sp. DS2015]|uniref:hypothetical protein n=1 Tax=Paenibacillus sp. DS2015 TaxID=3373917 RepID=UPI003D1E833F